MAARKIKVTAEEQQEARKELRRLIAPGAEITMSLEYVSASGMSRHFKVLAVDKQSYDGAHFRKGDPYVRNVSHLVCKVIGYKLSDRGAVVVGGAGMDMSFHLADTLGRILYAPEFHSELTRAQKRKLAECTGGEHRGNFMTSYVV